VRRNLARTSFWSRSIMVAVSEDSP
jgi:hypothetical protein